MPGSGRRSVAGSRTLAHDPEKYAISKPGEGQPQIGERPRPLPAKVSYLALAGSVYIAPVAGSIHGHGLSPKKAGFDVRYIDSGMANPPGVLCQCWVFVRKS